MANAAFWIRQLFDFDGKTYKASLHASTGIAVEESGPMRAVIRASGWLRSDEGGWLAAYLVRIYAYAGQDFVKVECTLVDLTRLCQIRGLEAGVLAGLQQCGILRLRDRLHAGVLPRDAGMGAVSRRQNRRLDQPRSPSVKRFYSNIENMVLWARILYSRETFGH
jgi:hypothetical protein